MLCCLLLGYIFSLSPFFRNSFVIPFYLLFTLAPYDGTLVPGKNQKASCDGYSSLHQDVGAIAGLEIEKVDGYAKGYGYAVGVMTGGANHAWNVVNLDGR